MRTEDRFYSSLSCPYGRVGVIFRESKYENLYLKYHSCVCKEVLERYKGEWKRNHNLHYGVVYQIIDILESRGIEFDVFSRHSCPVQFVEDYDFLISVGGDGTFLGVAQRVLSTPMLGVNIDPSCSEGFLCSVTVEQFESKIDEIYRGLGRFRSLHRLAVGINGRHLENSVLNDVLIAHPHPAHTSKYILGWSGIREIQCSSGVWISTATGSTAALQSAGGPRLSSEDRRFAFWVREPCVNKVRQFSCFSGICEPGDDFSIEVLSTKLGLYVDGGLFEVMLGLGDIVSVYPHWHCLNQII